MIETKHKLLRGCGIALGGLAICAVVYGGYLAISYHRIPDNQPLAISRAATTTAKPERNTEYTVLCQNIGFGAYSADFSFFMDGGKESVARSAQAVADNIGGLVDQLRPFGADFLLIQEVDVDSTRSHHINEYPLMTAAFPDRDSTIAINYDSPYLIVPPWQPHGKSYAGLVTLSRYPIESAVRRSLPVTTHPIERFMDLDRCYSVQEIPMEGGKSLYLYNAHLSAYGGSPQIRQAQAKMLLEDMAEKYAAGNYVVCGGDFNQSLTKDFPDWQSESFPFALMPEGVVFAGVYQDGAVPTVRDSGEPYTPGESTTGIIDGFFVSKNITVNAVQNLDHGFLYSDHNPVLLRFTMQ